MHMKKDSKEKQVPSSEESAPPEEAKSAVARAREEARKRAATQEAAHQKAADEQARKAREAKEHQDRVDEQRLQQADRRVHAEAQTRLEQWRSNVQAEANRKQPTPWMLFGGVLVFAILVGGAALAFGHNRNQALLAEKKSRLEEQYQARLQQDKTQALARKQQIVALQDTIYAQEKQWNELQERDKQAALAQKARDAAHEAAVAAAQAEKDRKAAAEREKTAKLNRCKHSNDPLCGMD